MNPAVKAALDEVSRPDFAAGQPPLAVMRARRNRLKTAMDVVLRAPQAENRNLMASEQRDFDVVKDKLLAFDERIDELEAEEVRAQHSAETRRMGGGGGLQRGYATGPATYHPGSDSPSFFKDLIYAQRGDLNAADRLRRNNEESVLETRALGNTGGVGGSGGEFAPPAWLVDQFVALARAGRVTADLFHREPLPPGVSSINIPKVSTGSTTAVQTTQNTALSQTDPTTTALSSGITTIGGKVVVSQQLLDQSGIPFDRVVLGDLAADYARQLGIQVITGTGAGGQLRGVLQPASTSVQTWTTASPTAGGFYGQLAQLQSTIISTRYVAPDTVVMHPRRWAWLASAVDNQNRPLVTPGASYNTLAQPGPSVAAGHVGSLLGMDVYTDPNIPTNRGAGTNQDVVLMLVRDDIWLWESDLRAEALTAPYADTLGVLFRAFGYASMIPDRHLASLGRIEGTGLVPPVFTS